MAHFQPASYVHFRPARVAQFNPKLVVYFVRILQNDDQFYENINEGEKLNIKESLLLLRLILREKIWCYLVGENITIRVGHDFYLGITINDKLNCFKAIKRDYNLFIVEFNDDDLSFINDILNN